MNKKIIVGNWKMNPNTFREAEHLFREFKKHTKNLKNTNIILCTPSVFLSNLKKQKTTQKISLGAQNVFFENNGAFTGELSVSMIYEAGARYCIVGHSERRYYIGDILENDLIINKKIKSLLKAKIVPILCVGERMRDENNKYFDFIRNQIHQGLENINQNLFKNIIIAYEPVWAIGKDAVREATPSEINEMVIFIKKCISDISSSKIAFDVRILYGGSVGKNNIKDLLYQGNVDGFLVGRASLSVRDFTKIIDITENN